VLKMNNNTERGLSVFWNVTSYHLLRWRLKQDLLVGVQKSAHVTLQKTAVWIFSFAKN
jgi:hypothetical protein